MLCLLHEGIDCVDHRALSRDRPEVKVEHLRRSEPKEKREEEGRAHRGARGMRAIRERGWRGEV